MKKPAFIGGPVQDEIDEIWTKITQLQRVTPKTKDEARVISDQLLALGNQLATLYLRLPEPHPPAMPLDMVSEVFRFTRPYTYNDLYQSMVAMGQLPSKPRMRGVLKRLAGQDATLVAKILKDAMDKDDVMLYELLRDAGVAGYDQAVDAFINTTYPGMTFEEIFLEAAKVDKVAVVQLMLDKGVDKDTVDHDRWTALIWAAAYSRDAMVQRLLDAGANMDIQDPDGMTALMWAVQEKYDAVAQRLLDAGAGMDIRDIDGMTALMWAAGIGSDAMVQRLLEAGASKDIKTKDGKTALMLAKTDAIRQLLLQGRF